MKIEDIENASEANLRKQLQECYARVDSLDELAGTTQLYKARFLIDELERRKNDKVSRRDFWLEIAIIILISIEIGFSYVAFKEAPQQLRALNATKDALIDVQQSSATTAATLSVLQQTMQMMNSAVQRQAGLLSEVSVAITYDVGQKRIIISDTGNADLTLWGDKISDQLPTMNAEPFVIPHGGFYYLLAESFYKEVSTKLVKGSETRIPFEIYLKNDTGQKYVVRSKFFCKWDGDVLQVNTQTTAISKSNWTGVTCIAPR
jgi:hypothetical protein